MNSFNSALSSETNEAPSGITSPKVPRLTSLLHRLQRAKDARGRPLPYLDELMLFIDDPPPGTRDRWKEGADLCRSWGFETSGGSVYRLYNSRRQSVELAREKPRLLHRRKLEIALDALADELCGNPAAEATFNTLRIQLGVGVTGTDFEPEGMFGLRQTARIPSPSA